MTEFPYSSVNDYLDECFEGQDPDPVSIKAAKARYWSMYRIAWVKNHRKSHQQYCVSYSFSENEQLHHQAGIHELSPTRYIKYASLQGKDLITPKRSSRILRSLHELKLAVDLLKESEEQTGILITIETLEYHLETLLP